MVCHPLGRRRTAITSPCAIWAITDLAPSSFACLRVVRLGEMHSSGAALPWGACDHASTGTERKRCSAKPLPHLMWWNSSKDRAACARCTESTRAPQGRRGRGRGRSLCFQEDLAGKERVQVGFVEPDLHGDPASANERDTGPTPNRLSRIEPRLNLLFTGALSSTGSTMLGPKGLPDHMR